MIERSYSQLGIDGLEEQARLASDDAEIRQSLMLVLKGRRQSPRVKKLREQLERLGLPQSQEISVAAQTSTTSSNGRPPSSISVHEHPLKVVAPPRAVSAEEHESLLRVYESLRATFTAEAELLARWGMTPAMPLDLQDLVFEEWRKRISRAPSQSMPSAEALSEDRIRIVRERDVLPDAVTSARPLAAQYRADSEPSTGEDQ